MKISWGKIAIWWGIIGAVLVIIVAIASTPTQKEPQKQQAPDQKSGDGKFIPGITAASVYLPLKEKGLTCDKGNFGKELSEWRCSQKTISDTEGEWEYDVIISTTIGSDNIETVTASVTNFSNKKTDVLAQYFLGFVASLPYDGSEPEKAREWVKANINKPGNAVIGSVRFALYGKDRLRTLKIAGENSDLD